MAAQSASSIRCIGDHSAPSEVPPPRPGLARLALFIMAFGLTLAACDDTGGPSTGQTGVRITTTTTGLDLDPNGYQVTANGAGHGVVSPNETVLIPLDPGSWTIALTGLTPNCAVVGLGSWTVTVVAEVVAPVAFAVTCTTLTGVRITTTTTGVDPDPQGYRVTVDDTSHGLIPPNGTLLIPLDPGSRTIVLQGLTSNCTITGPGSQTATIVDKEIVGIDFAVTCTATTGVIGVVVEVSGTDVGGYYWARVDGTSAFQVGPGRPAYLSAVTAGDHVVTIDAPLNCSVQTTAQSVAVTVGGLIRDTVEATFSVSCVPRGLVETLSISATTTGPTPAQDYSAWTCAGYCDSAPRRLGGLAPNGTLITQLPYGYYYFYLRDVPANCLVDGPNLIQVVFRHGFVGKITFRVVCTP